MLRVGGVPVLAVGFQLSRATVYPRVLSPSLISSGTSSVNHVPTETSCSAEQRNVWPRM